MSDDRFIYLLEATELGLTQSPTYDVVLGQVVIARNSKVARTLASGGAKDEGADFWKSRRTSSIRKIGVARKPNAQPAQERVVLREGVDG